jgi:hypothetical protein
MMVAVFVVSDFPWWFVLVLAGLSLPWWAGIAALAAVVPTPGVRRRWRWAAGAGGVVAAGMLYFTMGLVASRAENVGAYETVDQAMWTINGAAVVAAVVLLLRRHAVHRRDR